MTAPIRTTQIVHNPTHNPKGNITMDAISTQVSGCHQCGRYEERPITLNPAGTHVRCQDCGNSWPATFADGFAAGARWGKETAAMSGQHAAALADPHCHLGHYYERRFCTNCGNDLEREVAKGMPISSAVEAMLAEDAPDDPEAPTLGCACLQNPARTCRCDVGDRVCPNDAPAQCRMCGNDLPHCYVHWNGSFEQCEHCLNVEGTEYDPRPAYRPSANRVDDFGMLKNPF